MTTLFEDSFILKFKVASSWARGDLDKTIVLCTRLLKVSPNYHDAYWKLADQLLKKRKLKKAKEKWKRAVELSPNLLYQYDDWVYALYFAREFEEAILFAEKYPDRFNGPCETQNVLGICYLHLGDYENAIKCFEKATLMKNDFSIAYYNWALAIYFQGNKEEAEELYMKASQISGLDISAYEREVKRLKEDLKREENGVLEDFIKTKIEGFEYFIELEKGDRKC